MNSDPDHSQLDDDSLIKIVRELAAPAIKQLARRRYATQILISPSNCMDDQDVQTFVKINKEASRVFDT